MRQALAERLLAEVMKWTPEDVARERPRLDALALVKYDSYEQFAPGERFVERLATWLAQFQRDAERQAAYAFVTQRLLFVSNPELNHLISMAYPDCVRPVLLDDVAKQLGQARWNFRDVAANKTFSWYQRSVLVMALSDGARLGIFRRAAAPEIGHEQVFGAYELSDARAKKLLAKLRADLRYLGDPASGDARFRAVLLLDDFVGSGRTLLRRDALGQWDGKLWHFLQSLQGDGPLGTILQQNGVHVIILHYVGTRAAIERLTEDIAVVPKPSWVQLSLACVLVLPRTVALPRGTMPLIDDLLDRYYDDAIEDEHTDVGGTPDLRYGFGGCALPVVLAHNTPNNSISLLWAETEHVRALFPRVSRHQSLASGDAP